MSNEPFVNYQERMTRGMKELTRKAHDMVRIHVARKRPPYKSLLKPALGTFQGMVTLHVLIHRLKRYNRAV